MARKNKQQIITMLICILISFILWLYVMGEQNPVQTKVIEDVPVYFTNLENLEQNNLTILPNQTFTVNLTITGRAMDVYKVKPEDFRVEADLGGYIKKGINNIMVEVKSAPKGISVVYDKGMPYVKVKVDSLLERTIPVSLNILGKPKEGYGYINPSVKPMEVLIRGAETYVSKASSALINVDLSKREGDLLSSLPVKIIDSYGDTIQYVSVEPKYVDVFIPIKPSKKVNIVVKTKGNLLDSKILNSLSAKPSEITILGDKNILNSINFIETEPIDLSKVNESISKTVKLIIPKDVYIEENFKNITVEIKVENKVEKNFVVDVGILNINNNFDYSIYPDKINVTVEGPESIVNSLSSEDIRAYVDVENKNEGEHYLPIKIEVLKDVNIKKMQNQVLVKINKK